jgi:two-component system, response regulator, stage 0 sporulation protein F
MRRILIVDDEVIIRIAFKKLLDHYNCIIDQARNLKEALELLTSLNYDVILLDLQLAPDNKEGGFQILQKLKSFMINQKTPVIIVSGKKTKEEIQKRLTEDDNVAKILIKPVENDQIIQAIGEVLDKDIIPKTK